MCNSTKKFQNLVYNKNVLTAMLNFVITAPSEVATLLAILRNSVSKQPLRLLQYLIHRIFPDSASLKVHFEIFYPHLWPVH